jgi:signal transduction histidine kinase
MSGERLKPAIPALIIGTAAAAATATLLITVLPFLDFAYRSPPLHVAIETAATIVGLIAAYLVLGRFNRSGSRADLLLVIAFALLATTNLCFSTIPALSGGPPGTFDTWTPVAGRLLGALGLALAAYAPPGPLRSPRRTLVLALGGSLLVLGLIAAGVALLGDVLPTGIDAGVSPEGSTRPRVVGSPGLLSLQVVGMLLLTAAAAGFARKASRSGDQLMGWLAAACVLAAFARLNYFLFPSLYSEWVYTGDFLRLGSYLMLLAGALREIRAYQEQLAHAATLEERRRIARDLHDGVTQELAFISVEARRIATAANGAPAHTPARLDRLSAVADRALDESRHAIGALTNPEESLVSAIDRAAEELSGRTGAKVKANVEPDLNVAPESRDSLVRIVREAASNAVRHGGASLVEITLVVQDGIHLTIRDNGRGFDGQAREGGFGLVSMTQRAERLGGELSIDGRSGEGTVVRARLPSNLLSA